MIPKPSLDQNSSTIMTKVASCIGQAERNFGYLSKKHRGIAILRMDNENQDPQPEWAFTAQEECIKGIDC